MTLTFFVVQVVWALSCTSPVTLIYTYLQRVCVCTCVGLYINWCWVREENWEAGMRVCDEMTFNIYAAQNKNHKNKNRAPIARTKMTDSKMCRRFLLTWQIERMTYTRTQTHRQRERETHAPHFGDWRHGMMKETRYTSHSNVSHRNIYNPIFTSNMLIWAMIHVPAAIAAAITIPLLTTTPTVCNVWPREFIIVSLPLSLSSPHVRTSHHLHCRLLC